MRKQEIPLIEASDTNYNAGYKIGQRCKSRIERLIETSKRKYFSITGRPFEYFIRRSERMLDICRKGYGKYIDEIKGITDGAGVDFDEYFALNFEDEVIDFAEKCTTLFLKNGDDVYLGHNEDWTSDFIDKLYILRLKQRGKPNLMFLSYLGPPQFIIASLNSSGIAFTANSLYVTHKLGVPEALMLRMMADANSIKEAIKDLKVKPRAMGMNSMIVFKDRVVDVENSLNKSIVIDVKGDCFVHTNHPLKLRGEHSKNSLVRYNRASEILENADDKNINLIKKILSDHRNSPDSVCRHSKKNSEWATIASVIIDIARMRMLIAQGNPCKNKYKEYRLN